MALFTALAIGAAVAGVAGTIYSYMGQRKAQKGAEKAERIRETEMQLQAARNRRQSIRQAIITRAQATSNATAQGAGDGSGLQGGLSQISNANAQNQRDISQGLSLGTQMFAANRMISSGQTMASIGQSIQQFGSYLGDNYSKFERVYNYQTG